MTERQVAANVLGGPLQPCSFDPLTGWLRDGCCNTDALDQGSHVICVKVTPGFLNFQHERGNDLITPRPELRFAGLKPGDRWCEFADSVSGRLARSEVFHVKHLPAGRI